MGLPRVSLGGVQVRMRQSLFTFRHRTFRGEPGAPGFSAAASETQGGGRGGGRFFQLASMWPLTPPTPSHQPLQVNPPGLHCDLEDQALNNILLLFNNSIWGAVGVPVIRGPFYSTPLNNWCN